MGTTCACFAMTLSTSRGQMWETMWSPNISPTCLCMNVTFVERLQLLNRLCTDISHLTIKLFKGSKLNQLICNMLSVKLIIYKCLVLQKFRHLRIFSNMSWKTQCCPNTIVEYAWHSRTILRAMWETMWNKGIFQTHLTTLVIFAISCVLPRLLWEITRIITIRNLCKVFSLNK